MPNAHPGPFADGLLDVGDGQQIHYWTTGDPAGAPLVMLHGGPGSGCPTSWAEYADPTTTFCVGLDQRGCGLSTPDAADPGTGLAVNTTQHLIADLEMLRRHLGIGSWTVVGGSWGSILGLAYAQRYPQAVDAMVLFSVPGAGRRELDWVTRDVGRLFPDAWERFRAGASGSRTARSGDVDLIEAYAELLADDDPGVRAKAARAWCDWEDAHVSLAARHDLRYDDPVFCYRFARLVTHYWRHEHFLEADQLFRDVDRLRGIPAVLVQGRLDVSGPPDVAWRLSKEWPGAEFVLCDDAGHGLATASMREVVTSTVARFTSDRG